MKDKFFTVENILYLAAFLLAAGLRLIGLGRETLSDYEATLALQALDLSKGTLTAVGPQPLYIIWTGVLFFVFEASNALARLLPALAGSVLVLAPILYRRFIRRGPALILAFGLAVSPLLVGASRQADGLVLSLCFVLFAAGFLLRRAPAAAGIFSGLALLSGPALWMILLVLAVTALWGRLIPLRNGNPGETELEDDPSSRAPAFKTLPWRETLPWLLGTLLIAGTCFFIQPAGLSAAASSIVSFLAGWVAATAAGFSQLVFGLAASETLALAAGLWALFHAWFLKARAERYPARLLVVCLALVMLYPGKHPLYLALAMIPLWYLAAVQIERWFASLPEEGLPTFALSAVVFILLVFGWMNVAGVPAIQQNGVETQLRWLSLAGALVISLLIGVLVAWGWSPAVGRFGLRTGVLSILALFLIFGAWHSTGLGRHPAANPWRTSAFHEDADLLARTIEEFSEWNANSPLAMDLTVVGVDSPGLKWLLRGRENVEFSSGMAASGEPSLMITPLQSLPPNSTAYTGQDFMWSQSPSWSLMLPREWMQWALYREAPYDKEEIVLWVRSDLFAGASSETAPQSAP